MDEAHVLAMTLTCMGPDQLHLPEQPQQQRGKAVKRWKVRDYPWHLLVGGSAEPS